MLQDQYRRTIDYLRISVTDRCQARCIYCMPKDGIDWIPHEQILSFEDILYLAAIMAELGIKKIKVTGGEPLVRRGIINFIEKLVKINGIEKVTLTTNGILLADNLDKLLDAGIKGINISLDSLDAARFESITKSNALEQVLKGLYMAIEAQAAVKINCVPAAGCNEEDIIPIAALAKSHAIAVRFIELMPLGAASRLRPVTCGQIKKELENKWGSLEPYDEKLGEGPAQYYRINGFNGKIGFISSLTHAFCGQCNRIRLSSTGLLNPCLASKIGIDIKTPLKCGESAQTIKKLIYQTIFQKPQSHNFIINNSLNTETYKQHTMHKIGG